MKTRPNAKRMIARIVVLLYAAAGLPAQAALTDLTSYPLANVSGTAAVKPNIMFLLDDSGSMMQQYTPDYVSERWGTPAASDRHCYDSGDDTDANRDLCIFGDPPYMSPDFNKQYYNPNITYVPPTTWDGVAYPSQTAANTANWTAVKTDGFNVQNTNHFEQSATTFNIASQFPSRAWCTLQTDDPNSPAGNPACVTNAGGYFYPDATYKNGQDGTVNFNSSGGTGSTVTHAKFRYGNPYYYSILPGEYCSDEALTNCVSVALGSSPPAGSPFPARVRWCNSEANALLPIASLPAGSCQAKKIGAFQYARFSITAPASVAYGTLKIGDSGSNDSVTITQVQVNGATIMNTTVTAAGGTNSSGERSTFATALASAINSYHIAPGSFYVACAGAGCSLGPGITIPADTVAIIPTTTSGGATLVTDASHSGEAITVTTPVNNISAASGRINVGNAGGGSGGSVTNITVNGVSIIAAPISFTSGGTGGTARNNAATAIEGAIDGFLNSTPWEYTARHYNQSGCPNTNGQVCVDAPLSAGSAPNGYVINVTTAGGVSVSVNNFGAVSGTAGVSRSIPTTISNITAGASSSSSFQRVDIVPATAEYPKAVARTDCGATPGVCTYAEEMTNFANWYAYYRTRMQTMKSAAGHSFLPLTSDYRLGFTTINNTSFTGTSGSRWLALDELTLTQKQNWYTKFYAQSPSGSTPLRNALDRMGKYYEGTLGTAPNPPDPVQYSCQQNFTILTTDGYWNQSFTGYSDQDNVENSASFCTRANGCFDGNLGGGSANSLADVAQYYYYRDLRPSMADNVPTSAKDPNPAQHMTTFTLGLGVDGAMTFREDYETASAGDFYRIRTGATGCAWTAGTCNWPVPAADSETAVDDLWHAAVNGHGSYFSAQDPASLSTGLANALAGLKVRNAAASASATSTPNVTQEDNDIFSATFRTLKWDGELIAQKIDTDTGNLLPTETWKAQDQLDSMVSDSSDSRIIYTADLSNPTPARKNYAWAALTSAEQAYFSDKCLGGTPMSQCTTLTAAQRIQANLGEKMLNYVRGQQEMEVAEVYRARDHVLGDIASAKPAYVRNPRRNYGDVGYSTYKANNASRQAMVYVAANDGFLHALNAATGAEVWAYVPHAIYPDLYRLADANYGNNHRYYVDGSPESGDVYIGSAWRTILVGGLNKGGRGYYALDITEPANPLVLWEFCSDAALCSSADTDLGYTFGNPVITKRPSDGKWVVLVASGYNNVSPGSGRGYLYVLDAATGAVLSKIDTGAGDTTTPSGLARISGRAENAVTDNTATTVFGGDMLGNLWRFDMATNTVIKLASLTDPLNNAQPITTRPDVGKCSDSDATPMVFVGTGRYLGLSDLTDSQMQTVWGIKDNTATLGTVRSNLMVQQTLAVGGGGTFSISSNAVDLAAQNGWFVDLDQNTGERVNLDPQLVLGTLLVETNQPENVSSCSVGGNSFKYEFDFCSGKALLATGGVVGKKIGSSIAVGFIVIRLPGGALKVITTFAGAEKTTEGVTAGASGNTRRVSWRELQ